VAAKTEKAGEESELTNADWGKIHALAWKGDEFKVPNREGKKVAFREVLETDPTWAIRWYEDDQKQKGRKLNVQKIVKLRPRPERCDVPEEFWEDVNPFPPSCC
jgi:hypothetical protein